MGIAVTFVMALASLFILAHPAAAGGPEHRLPADHRVHPGHCLAGAVCGNVPQKRACPTLYQSLGVYLPLITTNCARAGRYHSEHPDELRPGPRHRQRRWHRARASPWPSSSWPVCASACLCRTPPRGSRASRSRWSLPGLMAMAFLGFTGLIR